MNEFFQECSTEIHLVNTPSGQLPVTLMSPPAGRLAYRPALVLAFALDAQYSLFGAPVVTLTTHLLLEAGHRVLTFDLPQHGQRVNDDGNGIGGLCNAFVAGRDPFAVFLAEASAVLDHAEGAGWAHPGGLLACGYSRGAYFTARLLAVEPRLRAAALFAPVTDWRALSEFAAHRDRPDVAALALTNYAEALAGRPIYLGIGHRDQRVSTLACCRLFVALEEANARRGFDPSPVAFHCSSDVDHVLGPLWYTYGVDFIFKHYGVEN